MERLKYGRLDKEFSSYEESKIVVLPVPYDGTSTWVKGSDKGPSAIFEASRHMEFYDAETDSEVYTFGIHTAEEVTEKSSPEAMVDSVKRIVGSHLDRDKFVVTLGGEHSVSIGAARAFAERFEDFSVLQLDAHTDLRNEYKGSEFNHGCTMARIREVAPIVQVGIRSSDVSEKKYIDRERVFRARNIKGGNEWIQDAIKILNTNVYLTLDIDVFDPAFMPSTGTPEPGGLDWYEVTGFLRAVTEARNLVGFDLVELCPNDADKAPDFLAAKLVYKILSYKFGAV